MPRIKNDPCFEGVPTMDSEDAAMVRASINAEEAFQLAANDKRHKITLCIIIGICTGLYGVCPVLAMNHNPFVFAVLLTLLPVYVVVRKEVNRHRSTGRTIRRTTREQLAELGLCPPLPR